MSYGFDRRLRRIALAFSQEDSSPVSVFKIATASPNDARLNAARNGVKRLRSVR